VFLLFSTKLKTKNPKPKVE